MIFRTARVVELCHHLGALAEDWCDLAIRVVARIDLVYDLSRSGTGVEFDLLGECAGAEREHGGDCQLFHPGMSVKGTPLRDMTSW